MDLLFLHGAPAVGKRTVAESILDLRNGRLFDNHAAIDFARTVLDFGAPGFWEMVHSSRLLAINQAAKNGVSLLVQTACYSHPQDLPLFEDFEHIVTDQGGRILPVFLTCSRETLESRVGTKDRAQRGKLVSKESLAHYLSKWNLRPVPRANCYTVETDKASPQETAISITEHFRL